MTALKPACDIIIPTYNRGLYPIEAALSAFYQLPKKSQIILVDDGSSDNTWDCLSQFADKTPFVKAVRIEKNSGVSHARNVGAKLATAPWLMFLDSDDVLFTNALNGLLSQAKADVVVGRFRRIDIDGKVGKIDNLWENETLPDVLKTKNVIGPSWSIIKKDMFDKVGGFDETLRTCEDWQLYRDVAKAGGTFQCVNTVVAGYRRVGPRLMDDTESLKSDGEKVRNQ